jgi:hypothetical protein
MAYLNRFGGNYQVFRAKSPFFGGFYDGFSDFFTWEL